MDRSRTNWEARAQAAGSDLSGVLFKGFRLPANKALHAWHASLIADVLAPRLPDAGLVLDLGCGYGRLTQELAVVKPSLAVVGQDLSISYCRAFSESGSSAVQASFGALPFAPHSFDGGMAVTSLMYVVRSSLTMALAEICRALRPGAPLLIVDPGEELRASLEFVQLRTKNADTGGKGFRRSEYAEMASAAGFNVMESGGNPRDTVRFLATAGGRVGWRFASRVLRADSARGGYSRFALHRWLLLQSPGGA